MRACRWSDAVTKPLVRSAPEEPSICPCLCKLVQIPQTAEKIATLLDNRRESPGKAPVIAKHLKSEQSLLEKP